MQLVITSVFFLFYGFWNSSWWVGEIQFGSVCAHLVKEMQYYARLC